MKKSLKKLLGYCFIFSLLLLIDFLCNGIIARKSRAHERLLQYIEVDNKMPKAVFIGSSRVKAGIIPALLKEQLPAYKFYNMGISGLGILYGCQLAEKIIPYISSGSIIYIELSDFRTSPSNDFYYFSTHDDLYPILEKRFEMGIELAELDKIFFSLVSIQAPLKAHLYPNGAFLKDIDLRKEKLVYTGTENLFLNKTDFVGAEMELTLRQKKFLDILNNVIESGKKKGTKVMFVIPLNIKGIDKKSEMLSVFSAIPEAHKWIYSTEFLEKISHNKYLKDQIHLNAFGAQIYTEELVNEIRKKIN